MVSDSFPPSAKFMSLLGATLGALLVYTLPATVALASAARTGAERGAVWKRGLRLLGVYGAASSVVGTAVLLRSW